MSNKLSGSNNLELNPMDLVDESYINAVISQSEVRADQYVFHLHPSSYGKNYYLVYQGKLREFKVLRTYLCPWNYSYRNNGKRVLAIHEMEISGIGKVYAAHNGGDGTNFLCKVYHSPKGYKAGEEAYLGYNADNLAEIQPFKFGLVKEHSYFSDNDYVAKKWYWDGTKAVSVNVTKVPMFYSFDGYDLTIPNNDEYALAERWCKTKEECEMRNTIEVDSFDKDDEKVEVEVTIASVKMKIKASDVKGIIDYIKGLE